MMALGEILTIGLAAGSAVAAQPPVAVGAAACFTVLRPLDRGAMAAAGDFAPTPCDAPAAKALRYDARARTSRATRDLAQGETIAAVPAFALASVKPGERLYMRVRVGPVAIEREVLALQPARSGQAVFVRTPEGAVLSLPTEASR